MYFYIDFFLNKAILKVNFEWDPHKNLYNAKKHGINFEDARNAFLDPKRVIGKDYRHSIFEDRYYCFGKVFEEVLTVRFTYRNDNIRIIGAGYWREGRILYEQKNH